MRYFLNNTLKFKKTFFYATVPALLLAVTLFLSTRPYYNWDIFPYMALAITNPTTLFDSTHAEVFREASLQMPNQDWLALYQRHPDLASNSNAFQGILQYFEIKPLYIVTIQFLHFAGINLVVATYVPSLASYLLITILLFWWLQKLFPLPYASVINLLIAAFPFLIDPARYSSPDMFCALFLMTGLFLLTEVSIIPGLMVASLAIFARPDAALFFLLLTLVAYSSQKIKLIPALLIGAASIVATFSLVGAGMLKEFLFTSKDYSTFWSPRDWVLNYGQSLWSGIDSAVHSYLILFTFIALITLYLRMKRREISKDLWSILILGTLGIFIIRYLLHPIVEDRMLISFYLLIIMGFCKTINEIAASGPLQLSVQKT